MRPAPLTTIKGGINRLRTKGGARADTLYDLLNGYVTEAGTVKARPGTRRMAVLDETTRGLVTFGETLHTFASQDVAVPAGYTLHLLVHPDSTEYDPIALEKIHFAEPFMGALYVVAEFADGAIYHYWLQVPTEWAANTEYDLNQLVSPSVSTGLVYRATRYGDPYPVWAAGEQRSATYDQSIVEPTVYNGFYYVCVQTEGDNPVSGSVEPIWPTESGAQVSENVDGATDTTAPTTSETPSANTPGNDTQDRYGSSRGFQTEEP